MTVDLAAWTREQIDTAEKAALAIPGSLRTVSWSDPGPWVIAGNPGGPSHTVIARIRDGIDMPIAETLAHHIALQDPAVVLRRCAADRALLDDLTAERHHVNDGDCWYTCAAATEHRDGGETCDDERRGGPCDCGRDTRVQRRVRLLAEGWGWTQEPADPGSTAQPAHP